MPLDRATSWTAEFSCPFWTIDVMKLDGSIPYCWAIEARKLVTSACVTCTSCASASVSSTIWSRSSFSADSSASFFCSFVALEASCTPIERRCSFTVFSRTPLGTGISSPSLSLAMKASRASVAWRAWASVSHCLRISAFSSSRVSNSEASLANSSSRSGSCSSLTEFRVRWIWAFSPSWSPPSSVLSNVVCSPADKPSKASSSPLSIVPEPIS